MIRDMKIVFRIDDLSPWMDMLKFERIMHLLEKFNALPLLGIVPDNLDEEIKYSSYNEDFWGLMNDLQKKGCMIGMHGVHHLLNHKSKSLVSSGIMSEFSGLSYQ